MYNKKSIEIHATNKARFSERLRFKEKYGIVKISETVDKVKVLRNRKKGEQNHLLRDKITQLNAKFSIYAHCTVKSLEELDNNLRHDFAIYQGYEYNQKSFCEGLNSIYETMDVCIAVIILVNTEFYGYETPLQFMESIQSGGPILAKETCQLKEKFSFLNNLLTESFIKGERVRDSKNDKADKN